MTPEGWVKKDISAVLKRYTPLWYFMPVSGAHGKAGIPDYIVCANGRFFTIEAKAEGGKATQLQNLQMSLINQAQGIGIVIEGRAEVMFLDAHLKMLGCRLK